MIIEGWLLNDNVGMIYGGVMKFEWLWWDFRMYDFAESFGMIVCNYVDTEERMKILNDELAGRIDWIKYARLLSDINGWLHGRM